MADDTQSSQSLIPPENGLITTSTELGHPCICLKSTPKLSSISTSSTCNSELFTNKKKKKKKKRWLDSSDTASSSTASSRRGGGGGGGIRVSNGKRNPRFLIGSVGQKARDVDTLALPLGMSIAAVIAQVLERKEADRRISVDHLSMNTNENPFIGIAESELLISKQLMGTHPALFSGFTMRFQICKLAVRESIENIYGDKYEPFVENFEKSFRSTLMTLRIVNESSEITSNRHQNFESGSCSSNVQQDCAPEILGTLDETMHTVHRDLANREMVLHNGKMNEQLALVSTSRNHPQSSDHSVTTTLEKSLIEQTRLNDLKTLEISLTMRKLELKEKELSLHSDMNFLERCKLSMGISKASFRAEKFKNELEEKMYSEMLKKSIDLFVAGLIIMLASIAYGAYVYSYDRLIETTGSCSLTKESKSWWMPKSMFSFNAVFQMIWCHIQVLSRMLFGLLVILSIIYLLFQRSSVSTQATMPVTSVLLLAVACGFSGKLCIDTLGGSGYHWLLLWELLCIIHFFSNVCASVVFFILHGPIVVNQTTIKSRTMFPYWIRQVMFYGLLIFLPLSCGLVPFASLYDWKDHFSSRGIEYFANYWNERD